MSLLMVRIWCQCIFLSTPLNPPPPVLLACCIILLPLCAPCFWLSFSSRCSKLLCLILILCFLFTLCFYLPPPSPPPPLLPLSPFFVFYTLLDIVSCPSAFISNHILPCISGARSLETRVLRPPCWLVGSGRQKKRSHFPGDIQAAVQVGFRAYSYFPVTHKLRAKRKLPRQQMFPAVSWPQGISSNFMSLGLGGRSRKLVATPLSYLPLVYPVIGLTSLFLLWLKWNFLLLEIPRVVALQKWHCTRSVTSTGEPRANANPQAPPQTHWLENPGEKPGSLCLKKTSRWCWGPPAYHKPPLADIYPQGYIFL